MSQNKASNSFLYKKLTDENGEDKKKKKKKEKEDGEDEKSKKNDANNIKEKTSKAMSITLSIFQTLTNPIWNLLYLLSYIVNTMDNHSKYYYLYL